MCHFPMPCRNSEAFCGWNIRTGVFCSLQCIYEKTVWHKPRWQEHSLTRYMEFVWTNQCIELFSVTHWTLIFTFFGSAWTDPSPCTKTTRYMLIFVANHMDDGQDHPRLLKIYSLPVKISRVLGEWCVNKWPRHDSSLRKLALFV